LGVVHGLLVTPGIELASSTEDDGEATAPAGVVQQVGGFVQRGGGCFQLPLPQVGQCQIAQD
jgi:hypothetical protein